MSWKRKKRAKKMPIHTACLGHAQHVRFALVLEDGPAAFSQRCGRRRRQCVKNLCEWCQCDISCGGRSCERQERRRKKKKKKDEREERSTRGIERSRQSETD